MDILEIYLENLSIEDSDLSRLLSKFKKVVTLETSEDTVIGLLKYESIPSDTAFVFKMPEEKILTFHTMGMKFDIDIYFFNKSGKLIKWYGDVKPEVKKISSGVPAAYAVEVLSKE